jgi:hypothetical protein
MAFELCWGPGNETCAKSGAKVNYAPILSQALMGYLLAPVILAGGAEWTAHGLQALIACLAVVVMVPFVLRLGGSRMQALVGGLLLVAIPPFLPIANTAMPDLLAMTLGLAGMERLLAWKSERRWHQAMLSALTLGMAAFARPHMIFLLPIGALWLFTELRSRKVVLWVPVAAAASILIVLNIVTRSPQIVAQGPSARFVDLGMTPRNLYAYFLYLAFPIPFAGVWLAIKGRKVPMLLIAPLIPVVMFHYALGRPGSLVGEWATAATLFGFTSLAHLIYTCCRGRDWTGLMLGLWILIPLPAIVYQHLPIKYMLAVMPAVIVILLRTLADLPKPRAVAIYATLAALCAVYSCVILRADADFADYGRRAAAELIAPHVAAGEKVWFGGQWGFFWYAQRAGATVAKLDGPFPQRGDLLAVGLMEGGDTTRARYPDKELVAWRQYDSPHGRTMGYGAGLYSNYFGDALWVWDPKATNTYELWRLR